MRQSEARWPFVLLVVVMNIVAMVMPSSWFTTELMVVVLALMAVMGISIIVGIIVDTIRECRGQ